MAIAIALLTFSNLGRSVTLTFLSRKRFYIQLYIYCKWFEPRSISSSYVVIVRVRVVLKRTVVGDGRFDNLSISYLQSQMNSVCQSMML